MRRKCISCGTPPTPYYQDTKNSLTQDHAAIFRDTQYAAGIQIPQQFVVPAIGEDVQICVKYLINLVVGSYIWSPVYGYLQIAHWDSCTGKIGLLNDGINGSAIPGTVVSEGSLFAVTARPCCADQDNFDIFPFLAEDYVIPAVNDSVTLAVTSTYGLIVGTNVRIGSNVYFLDNINSSLEIVVTNLGAGGTPGDTVEARDANGDLQYLITQAIASPCTSTGSDVVRLEGCDGADQVILTGLWEGQVPILQDATSSEAQYGLLDAETRTCTALTASLSVLAATSTYTIDVEDESIFAIGDIIQINFDALRWEVTDNTTPGELDIKCVESTYLGYIETNPGSTFLVPSGSSVCVQLTSDDIQHDLDVIDFTIDYGWRFLPDNQDGTYIAATAFSIPGDQTSYLKIGQKIRLFNPGVKYFNIASFSFGAGITTITIIPNSSYSIANTGIINVTYSLGNPQDFPKYFEYDLNPTGFSAFTFNSGFYWIKDSEIRVKGFVGGTSNATTFGVDLPIDADSTLANLIGAAYTMKDNTVALTTVGRAVATGSNTILLSKDQAALTNAWTNSGTKEAVFELSYIIDG